MCLRIAGFLGDACNGIVDCFWQFANVKTTIGCRECANANMLKLNYDVAGISGVLPWYRCLELLDNNPKYTLIGWCTGETPCLYVRITKSLHSLKVPIGSCRCYLSVYLPTTDNLIMPPPSIIRLTYYNNCLLLRGRLSGLVI